MPHNAIYAGSFDPIHNGHVDVIKRISRLYDNILIVVANKSNKEYMFTAEERVAMIKSSIREADLTMIHIGVHVLEEGKYLVDFANQIKYKTVIRGVRNNYDFEYEQNMERINKQIENNIETLLILPPPSTQYISSTLIKEHITTSETWEKHVRQIVPNNVFLELRKQETIKDAQYFWDKMFPKKHKGIFKEIVLRYNDPSRHYHNLQHIVSMLKVYHEVQKVQHSVTDFTTKVAIWFHDIWLNDEEKSAAVAMEYMKKMNLLPQVRKSVKELILCTKYEAQVYIGREAVLKDLDFSILGESVERYQEYKEGIRREYSDVPDRLFYPRRKKFLTKVLENCFIFFNPYLEEKYRKQALVNVKTELKEIEAYNIKN